LLRDLGVEDREWERQNNHQGELAYASQAQREGPPGRSPVLGPHADPGVDQRCDNRHGRQKSHWVRELMENDPRENADDNLHDQKCHEPTDGLLETGFREYGALSIKAVWRGQHLGRLLRRRLERRGSWRVACRWHRIKRARLAHTTARSEG